MYGASLDAVDKPGVLTLRQWITRHEPRQVGEEKQIHRQENTGKDDIRYVVLDALQHALTFRSAKRQINVIVKASKRQTGVSLARSVRGRLPEEVCVSPLLASWTLET